MTAPVQPSLIRIPKLVAAIEGTKARYLEQNHFKQAIEWIFAISRGVILSQLIHLDWYCQRVKQRLEPTIKVGRFDKAAR
jgi:hypothetical protein